MGQYSDKILVTGHKNPDTDSITSAITYSNFKNKLEGTDKYAAMRLGNVSDETRYVLDYFNVAEPTLIEAPLEEGDKVILVDHNEKSQTVDGIENAEVLEIIDHHRLGGLVTATPLFMRVQPVGCTGTIVYQRKWQALWYLQSFQILYYSVHLHVLRLIRLQVWN